MDSIVFHGVTRQGGHPPFCQKIYKAWHNAYCSFNNEHTLRFYPTYGPEHSTFFLLFVHSLSPLCAILSLS